MLGLNRNTSVALIDAADEFAHESRRQIGLVVKFGREKTVECLFVQRFVEQKFADRPVLEPVGALVRGVVQNPEARVQIPARGVMVQDLVDMQGMHAGKHTDFFTRQRGAIGASQIIGPGRSCIAYRFSTCVWPLAPKSARNCARARSAAPDCAPSHRGVPGVKAVEAVDHRLGVGAHRRGHARQRGRHVLQQFERAFAARPFIIGERHHADMGSGERARPPWRRSRAPAPPGSRANPETRSRSLGP